MGGRGSSGGGGGGGGGGRAVDAKMPELTGSAKQVSWASNIRSDALANVDALVNQASDEFGLSYAGGYISADSARTVRTAVVTAFQSTASASAIIDKRGAFSLNQMKNAMIEVEVQKRRGKR